MNTKSSEITIERTVQAAISSQDGRSIRAILRSSKEALDYALENVDEDWQKHPGLTSPDDIWASCGPTLDDGLGKYEKYLEGCLLEEGFTPDQIRSIPKIGPWNEHEHESSYSILESIDPRIMNEDGYTSRTVFVVSHLRCLRNKLATAKNGKELFEWCQFLEMGLNLKQDEMGQFDTLKTQQNYEASKQELRDAGNAAKRGKIAEATDIFKDDYIRHIKKEYGNDYKSAKKESRETDVKKCQEPPELDEKGRYIIPLQCGQYPFSLNKLIDLAKDVDNVEGIHRGGRPKAEK